LVTGARPCHLLVFRKSQQTFSGPQLLRDLARELRSLESAADPHRQSLITSALLRSGELETALADADNREAERLSQVTDLLARAQLDPPQLHSLASQAQLLLRDAIIPDCITISPPEGFCFYGLHPLDFADAVWQLPAFQQPFAVIGIRSIGATLSAAFAAGLQRRFTPERPVPRITVRPQGHPYDRRLEFSRAESAWILRQQKASSLFFVIDEGPGLSGSSFLSVAEALLRKGIAAQDIIFISSRQVAPESLVAPDAAARWLRFRNYSVASGRHRPAEAKVDFGGDLWRERVFRDDQYAFTPYVDPAEWPALWPGMSSPRYLSADGNALYKFEGHGRYGAAVATRAALIGEAEFGPQARDAGFGYTEYPMLKGRLLHRTDQDELILRRMAAYLAFRAQMFPFQDCDQQALREMTRHNVQELLGVDCGELHFELVSPVISDARMMPHEWLRTASGQLSKLDSASHGDDHFFPGPTDVAWDLAGTIVEWRLSASVAAQLLEFYYQFTGDDVLPRLQDYMIGYCAFQAAYHRMAASACSGNVEEKRLLRRCEDYLRQLRSVLSHTEVAQVA
jgi:hypothetical protein